MSAGTLPEAKSTARWPAESAIIERFSMPWARGASTPSMVLTTRRSAGVHQLEQGSLELGLQGEQDVARAVPPLDGRPAPARGRLRPVETSGEPGAGGDEQGDLGDIVSLEPGGPTSRGSRRQ